MPRLIDLIFIAAFCLVALELGAHREPKPQKPTMRELPRFDPTMAPKAMSDKCREEGKQLIAMQADGKFWGFECVEAETVTRPADSYTARNHDQSF